MEELKKPTPQDFETWEDFEAALDYYNWQVSEMETAREDFADIEE